jgi:hypothetical protein
MLLQTRQSHLLVMGQQVIHEQTVHKPSVVKIRILE